MRCQVINNSVTGGNTGVSNRGEIGLSSKVRYVLQALCVRKERKEPTG
jgi:hypothetical protein